MKIALSLEQLSTFLGVEVTSLSLPMGPGWDDAVDGNRPRLVVECGRDPVALRAVGAVTAGGAACTCGSGGHPRRCHVHPDRFGQHCWELGICATFDTLLPALAEGQERDGARKFWNALVDVLDFPASDAAALRGTPGAGEAPRGLDSERIRYMALLDAARIVHERDPGSRAIADLVEEAASLVPLPFSATDAHWVALMAKYPAPATPVDRRRPAREVLDDIDELCERTRTDGPTSMSMGDAVAEIRKLVEADRRGEP